MENYRGDPQSGRMPLRDLIYSPGPFSEEVHRDPSILNYFTPFGAEGEGHTMDDMMVLRKLFRTPYSRIYPQLNNVPRQPSYNQNTGASSMGISRNHLAPFILELLRQ